MAREKAEARCPVAGRGGAAADTTVALGRRILGKPADAGEAAAFLLRWAGGGTG
jgi:septum formation protein